MTAASKKLFLIDGLGALLSAFLLGIVLVKFEIEFGMPRNVLYFLAIIACLLATYSLTSFVLVKEKSNLYLKIIAFANLAYCCMTAGLIILFHREITTLGYLYFCGEVAVIVTLAMNELRTAANNTNRNI